MHDALRRRLMGLMTGGAALLVGRTATAAGAAAGAGAGKGAGAGEPPAGAALFERVRPLLTGLHDPVLSAFLAGWPDTSRDPVGAQTRPPAPAATVPVLRWLAPLCAAAPAWSSSWVAALAASAPSLTWRRSYSPATVGERFYENYGWTEFAGLTGPVPSEHLACGVLLLGPDVTYPPHRHEAEELYIPLAGTARWRSGTAAWREQPPGAVIHHARHEPHAMWTQAEPLLALYLWRSENLAQSSQLDAPA